MADPIAFRVNGADVEVDVAGRTPLIYVLRNDLGLRGTRFGCGEGTCGSCTVIVDGRAATACDTPLEAVAGRSVETVESLTAGPEPHPLLAAIVAEQAGQCGYCLSGILMRAKALLAATPQPTRNQIAAALDGNLCRCGAHDRIIRAVARAGTQEARP